MQLLHGVGPRIKYSRYVESVIGTTIPLIDAPRKKMSFEENLGRRKGAALEATAEHQQSRSSSSSGSKQQQQGTQDQSCESASLCVRLVDQTPENCSVQQKYWVIRFLIQSASSTFDHRNTSNIGRTYASHHHGICSKASPSLYPYVRPGKMSQGHGPER